VVGSLDARLNERVLIIFNGLYFQSSLTDDARVSRRRNLLFVLFSKFPSFFLSHPLRARPASTNDVSRLDHFDDARQM
jgi:hypothetical protein